MSNENELVIKIDQTGADKTAQAIGKVTAATKDNAKAVETQAKATKAASVDVGKFGSALGIAGNTVGQFNSTAGQMVSRLGAATGAIQSLSTMGLGPLGIAVTALNLTVTAGVALMAAYKEEFAGVTRVAREAARSLDEMAEAETRRANNRARTQRLQAAQESVGVQRAYVQDAEEQVRRLTTPAEGGRIAAPDAVLRAIAEVNRREDLLRRAEERAALEARDAEDAELARADAASLERTRRIQEEAARNRPSRGGGGAARAVAGDGGAFANASSAKAKAEQALADERAFADAQAALEEEKTRRTIEAQKERDELAYEERMAAEEKVTRLLEEEEERRLRAAEETDRARVESYQTAARAIEAIGGTIAGVYDLVDSAGASADESAEARQKRELKRMAFMQAVEAIVNAARSAAAFAAQDYVGGAAYAVASGLNVAAAAKAGVDAGNVPRTSGASAGGGMSRDNASRTSGSQGAGTIVINMNGPVIAASDRAELGRQLGQIINEGAGRYGS